MARGDIGDLGNESYQHSLDVILSKRPKFDKKSLEECIGCGDDIPLFRQNLGAVERCVDCQDRYEKKTSHYRR